MTPRATRRPRELYEGSAPADPARPSTSHHDAGDDATRGYAGEFEQRSRGPDGVGPRGEIRSRDELLASLQERIAEDPALRGCELRVALGAQGASIEGSVRSAAQRDRVRRLAEAAGIGPFEYALRVQRAPRAGR